MAEILLVVAPRGFRDEEALVPKARFEASGHRVTVASVAAGACRGSLGAWIQAPVSLAETRGDRYDAVVFAGGEGSLALVQDASAHRVAREAWRARRPVGALCAAVSILAEAGLLEGRRATAWPERHHHLRQRGAVLCDGGVVTDPEGIVTAAGPAWAAAFADAMLRLLPAST